MSRTCIVITGPTAVGKTALSIRLASLFNTSILSADSRQCYREMNIGVAKPSAQELAQVPHYFINSHSIHDTVNAALFEQYALASIKSIFARNDVAIVVGGTGLYIQAFCNGIDEVPVVDPAVRNKVREESRERGLEWLQREVEKLDPVYFASGEIYNPHRLMRSLEVVLSTGRSIRYYQTARKQSRDFNILKIGLELPRERLYQQINRRVEDMLDQGLVEEVKSLLPLKHLPPLNTIGYKEIVEFLEDRLSLKEATEKIKTNTRHYAKRQVTWFKKEPVNWFSPLAPNEIIDFVHEQLERLKKSGGE